VRLSETLCADDTREKTWQRTLLCCLFQLLQEDFGLEAHSRPPGSTKESKTLVVFLAAPKSCYKDYGKLVLRGARSGADLGDVDVGGGRAIHVAESAKYEVLGEPCTYIAMVPTDRMCLRASSLPRVRLGAYGGASSHGGT
jgi:hypothetical protein